MFTNSTLKMRARVGFTSNAMTMVAPSSICIGLCLAYKCIQNTHVNALRNWLFKNEIFCGRVGQRWYVSDEIGSTASFMKADAGSMSQTTPPLKGWRYADGSKWNDDPEMECGKPSLPCMAVTVELSGKSILLQIKDNLLSIQFCFR